MKNLTTQDKIKILSKNLENFLIQKNKNYGDSALNPIQIFSKEKAENQICNRIDDKLNRIKNGKELRKNDTVDLIGYLYLICIQNNWIDFKEFID